MNAMLNIVQFVKTMRLFVGWRYNRLQHIGRPYIHKFFFILFSVPVTMVKIETETT